MRVKYLLASICLFSVLFSCKKDLTQNNEPVAGHGFNIPSPSPVAGKISGIVVDENNTAVQNAEVVFSGTTYLTDAKGFFNINSAMLDKYVTTVTVNKTGYFKAFRSWSATAGRNYLSIKLIPKTLAATISALGGGTATLSNSTTITLQANSIVVKSTGAAYTGEVKVYAAYIDPTASDLGAIVPGSMMGKDAEHMFILQSTGMVAVDLESPAGEALQLASGKTAGIKLPIPSSLTGKAPATIDTWSLNEQGIWVKEGTATKNGNYFDMQVTHFSFWNCDYGLTPVHLTIHIQDNNGNPISNTVVQLTMPNNNTLWATTSGITDSSGTVAGLVPSNEALLMSVYPDLYTCTSAIISQNIGPFSTDTTLNLTVTLSSSQYTVVSGTVLDCNTNPLANGYVWITDEAYHSYYAGFSNGQYSVVVNYCSPLQNITVYAADTVGGIVSSGPVAVTGPAVNVAPITVCNANPNAVYNIIGCQTHGNFLRGVAPTPNDYIMIIVDVLSTGQYNNGWNNTIGGGAINLMFNASGTFTHIGLDTIYAMSMVSPVLAGTYTFDIASNGTYCASTVIVYDGSAVFNCVSNSANGSYMAGFPINGQTETITVDVTTAGTWGLYTEPVNGVSFSGYGTFTSTGVQQLVLSADGGGPWVAGTFTYIPLGMPGAPCSFSITVN